MDKFAVTKTADKFVLTKKTPMFAKPGGDGRCPVRIPAEAYMAVRRVAFETHRPITQIIAAMVDFCTMRLEIREEGMEETNGVSIT